MCNMGALNWLRKGTLQSRPSSISQLRAAAGNRAACSAASSGQPFVPCGATGFWGAAGKSSSFKISRRTAHRYRRDGEQTNQALTPLRHRQQPAARNNTVASSYCGVGCLAERIVVSTWAGTENGGISREHMPSILPYTKSVGLHRWICCTRRRLALALVSQRTRVAGPGCWGLSRQHIHDTLVRGPHCYSCSWSGMTTPLPCAVRPQDLGSAPYEVDLESDGVRQTEAGRQEETEGPGQGTVLLLRQFFSPPTARRPLAPPHPMQTPKGEEAGACGRRLHPWASECGFLPNCAMAGPGLAAVACARCCLVQGQGREGRTHAKGQPALQLAVPHMESCAPLRLPGHDPRESKTARENGRVGGHP